MYCTQDDILKKIPADTVLQLTDDAGLGVIDADRVDEAITDAGREIDAWCGVRYVVPFTTVPEIIPKLAVDIAIYNLYSRVAESIPETRDTRYKNAINMLKGISKGDVSLGDIATVAAPVVTGKSPEITSSPRLFSRDKLKGL